jgi:hypothetical protein
LPRHEDPGNAAVPEPNPSRNHAERLLPKGTLSRDATKVIDVTNKKKRSTNREHREQKTQKKTNKKKERGRNLFSRCHEFR